MLLEILKTRLNRLPLTERLVAPGPMMLRLVWMTSSLLVSAIVPLLAKTLVSLGSALAIAWRKEPGPLSASVVTTFVVASAVPTIDVSTMH